MLTFMKFSWSAVMRECLPDTPSAKTACPTVKQSASGTRARSELGTAYQSMVRNFDQKIMPRNKAKSNITGTHFLEFFFMAIDLYYST